MRYEETMQSSGLRLMGRKLLVSLAMAGKFSREGLSLDEDDDMLTVMMRELVTENGCRGVRSCGVASDRGGEQQYSDFRCRG